MVHHLRAFEVDHTQRMRLVSAVQHNHVAAVASEHRRHRKRIQRHLLPRRLYAPAAVQKKLAVRLHADLLPRCGLGRCRNRKHEHGQECEPATDRFHSENLWAIGKRRPMPNALVVTFRPGAACWRLYSLRSTLLMMSRTSSIGTPCDSAICRGD